MPMLISSAALLLALFPEKPQPAPGADAPLSPAVSETPAQAQEGPIDDWTGAITLGLAQAYGNTERTNLSLTGDGVLRREKDRITLGAWWYYAEEEDDAGVSSITERRYGAKGKYDYFLSKKSYVYVNTLAERDDKADLQLRFTVGPGYGYQFYEEEDFKLSGEIGVAYFLEDYQTPEPTPENPNPMAVGPEDYIAGRVAYNVEYKPSKPWTLAQTGEAYPSLEDSEDFYSKLDSRVRYDLTENFFSQFQWIWDYDNTPAAGNERSDHRLLLTVGYSF